MSASGRQDLARTIGIAAVFTLYTAVVFGFGIYLFSLVVTVMRDNLGFAYGTIGIVTGAAQIAYLAAAFACPVLVGRFGGGQVAVAAVAAAALLLALMAGVRTVAQVGAILAGLGATAAFMMIPTVGVISRSVPFRYRSRVNGLVSSGTAYGQFANGMLVPWLLPGHGWRMVWIAAGAASLVIALAGCLMLRRVAPEAFGRAAAPEPASEAARPANGWRDIVTARNLTVWTLLALSGMVCGPWQNYLSSFLADERGRSLATIGQLWSIVGMLGLVSGFAAGMAADKAGVRISLALSYALLAGSALLIAFHAGTWQLQAAAVCFGLSFYAVYGLIPAYISKTADPATATTVFAIANVFLGVGATAGNLGGGYLPRVSGSLQSVFVGAAMLACAGMALTFALGRERREAE
ncbi:MFS transporter [Burkholderia sp. Ac-20379]|uniref:MFS transporter n=1 Tax=Burkholderia sp. Ac-20379 TaxID=2703900 RepID=UPI001980831A|nr:MFS transporter [Burkholderia sp. Ac-20379]MBN3723655.1 YbfB/YjiJ family MFS transporter [Burkholderia sp. Ac-20379]